MKILFFYLLLISYLPVQAQAPYRFSQISLQEGLSDSRVRAITQDKYGFMWFGTSNGLNRYDGYAIKKYYSNTGNTGLPSNYINCLYTAKNGELWVGTSRGLARYNFLNDRFQPVITNDPESERLKTGRINDIIEDKVGNIYIACFSGILRYLPKENRWENLRERNKANEALRKTRRLAFFNDSILLATTLDNNPLFTYNIKTDVLDSIQLLMDGGRCCLNLYDIEVLNEGEVLAGFLSYGIVKINIKEKTFATVPGVLSKTDSILYNSVYDIHKDSRGRVWLASFYFRLAEYIPDQNRVAIFEEDPYNPYGFKGNEAECVFEDNRNNIWTGTSSNGVFHFNPQHNAVRFHVGNDFKPGALQQAAVRFITEIDSNRLFIGTSDGPSIYDKSTDTHTNYKGISTFHKNAALEAVQIGIPDQDKMHFWMGTNRLGLSKYHLKTGSFKNYNRSSKPFPLREDGITDLLQLDDGNIFLIGFGTPAMFNPKTTFYTSFRNDSGGIFKLRNVQTASFDQHKNIWLGESTGGLYQYNPITKSLLNKTEILDPIGRVQQIFMIANQAEEIFITTNIGLIVLSEYLEPALYALPQNGLFGGDFTGVLPDGDYVWVCSDRTLGRLDRRTGKIIFLGEKEGLDNVQLYKRSLIKTSRQTIMIGSDQGYYEIFPENLQSIAHASKPFVTDFRVNDRSLPMPFFRQGERQIQLKYNENFFSFDLSSFDYEEAADIQYAYMLKGFDSEWQYTTNQRTGIYTNVPGGNYKLLLKAKNASGEWIENTEEIKIIVDRHFNTTWWFKGILALVIGGLVFWFYRFRMKQVNKEADLRSDYEIKLNELENSALRTQMNPHFIFNSLNTINAFISMNETVQAHKYIAKFSRLIRYILDHSRQRKILLADELEVLKLYIEIEQVRFQNKFQYQIEVDENIDTHNIEIPPLIIQPFVENAILHGLLPMEKDGFLKIEVRHEENLLLCIVNDNGIGRKRSAELKQSNVGKRTSHGIDITLKRIRLFNKERGSAAEVIITDLNPGTSVVIPVSWEETY